MDPNSGTGLELKTIAAVVVGGVDGTVCLYRNIGTRAQPRFAEGVQLLMADGSRSDYILPRSEALDYNVPWHIDVRIATKHRIAAVYSPSHEIATRQKKYDEVIARFKQSLADAPQGEFAVRAKYGLAAAAFAKEDLAGALAALNEVLAGSPEPAIASRARYLRGLVFQRRSPGGSR